MTKDDPVPAGNLDSKVLLLPKESFFPTLEPGERLVEAGGLVLVYDAGGNLVYMKSKTGKNFSVSSSAYRSLELLGSKPGQVFTYEQLLLALYDYQNEKRPNSDYFSMSVGSLKRLRREFKRVTGSDPIINHHSVGYSIRPTAKTP